MSYLIVYFFIIICWISSGLVGLGQEVSLGKSIIDIQPLKASPQEAAAFIRKFGSLSMIKSETANSIGPVITLLDLDYYALKDEMGAETIRIQINISGGRDPVAAIAEGEKHYISLVDYVQGAPSELWVTPRELLEVFYEIVPEGYKKTGSDSNKMMTIVKFLLDNESIELGQTTGVVTNLDWSAALRHDMDRIVMDYKSNIIREGAKGPTQRPNDSWLMWLLGPAVPKNLDEREENQTTYIAFMNFLNVNDPDEQIGTLWMQAHKDLYYWGVPLTSEDIRLGLKLLPQYTTLEPKVVDALAKLKRAGLSEETILVLEQLITLASNASYSLRGAHYVFWNDNARNYDLMIHHLQGIAQRRQTPFDTESKAQKGLLISSHYTLEYEIDVRLTNRPQIGLDIPGVGHLLFGVRPSKTPGEMGLETWFQFEAHGEASWADILAHGLDYLEHKSKGNAQIGPIGFCRFSEKNDTELYTDHNL